MGERSVLCSMWKSNLWSSVALYSRMGMLTRPKLTAPDHIARMAHLSERTAAAQTLDLASLCLRVGGTDCSGDYRYYAPNCSTASSAPGATAGISGMRLSACTVSIGS